MINYYLKDLTFSKLEKAGLDLAYTSALSNISMDGLLVVVMYQVF